MFASNPPVSPRRVAVVLLTASFTLGLAPAAAAASPEPAPPPLIDAASIRADEDRLVEGATSLTDLTATEARDIFRNRPDLAAMIPVAVTDVTHVTTTSPSRGVESAASPRLPVPPRWCRVWTQRKIRNRAGMVLFSFKLTQSWRYNHTRVWPHTPRADWDVTNWGHWLGGWYYNGIVDSGGYYKSQRGLSPYAIHRSYRTGQFRTADVAGGFTVNVPLFIEKWYNGDWVSTTKYGLPGCQNA